MGLLNFWKKLFILDNKSKKKSKKVIRKRLVKRVTKKTKRIIRKKKIKKPKKKTVRKIPKKSKTKRQSKSRKRIHRKLKHQKIKKRPSRAGKKLSKTSKEREIGVITHYFDKISVGIVKLKSSLKVGEKIRVKGTSSDFTQFINSMQLNHQGIQQAKKGDEIGIKIDYPVHENDRVYKLTAK